MEVGDDAVGSSLLVRLLVRLGPPLPSPSDGPSWSAFLGGCLLWGSAPLYAGIVACAVVAVRFSSCCQSVEGRKPRRAQLPWLLGALAAVMVAGGVAFVAGLSHVAVVQEKAASISGRVQVAEETTARWIELTSSVVSTMRGILPGCAEDTAPKLAFLIDELAEAEKRLYAFIDELQGPLSVVGDAGAWWKSRPQMAAVVLLPTAMVVFTCAGVWRVARRRHASALKAVCGRFFVLATVVSSILVVSATSAALSTLGVAAAAFCNADDLSLLICFRPSIDRATSDACLGYMKSSRVNILLLRPYQANRRWLIVESAQTTRHLIRRTCLDGTRILELDHNVSSAIAYFRDIQDKLDPEDVHAEYRSAYFELCGGFLSNNMLVAFCLLAVGAALLPSLFYVAVDCVERRGGAAERSDALIDVELRSAIPALETPTAKGNSFAGPWAT